MKARPFHHQRPLAAVAALYGLGVGMGILTPWMPLVWGIGLLCALALTLLLPKMGCSRVTGCMALFFFIGALRAGYAAHPALPPEGYCTVEATAAQDFFIREDGKAAGYLENVHWTGENGEGTEGRVYWTYAPDEEMPFLPMEGERIAFAASLYHPQPRKNPYGFDFRMFVLQHGAAACLSGAREPVLLSHPGRGLRSVFYQTRKQLEERVDALFGEDAALPKALLLGIRQDIPEETKTGFEKAGAAHILSISGLHVGLLAGAVLAVLKRFLSPKGRLAVLGFMLLCYCALLDFSPPVTRASLLILLMLVQDTVRRAPDSVTLLAAAFLIILLVSPLSLFSASFVLSFCAVLGLCLWQRKYDRRFSFLRVRWLRRGVAASLSATLGTLLPTVYYFNRVSLIGLPLNPILCALFQLLLPAYAVVTLLGCLWLPLGRALAALLRFPVRLITAGVRALGSLPLATVRLPSPPWYFTVLLVLGIALTCRFSAFPRRRAFRLRRAALALALLLWVGSQYTGVRYIQFALGQSDAALLTDGDHTTLIDAGEYGGDVASFLMATGRKVDRLVLTHLHQDHCMGLTNLLEEDIPIGEVLLPEGAEGAVLSEDMQALMARLRDMDIPIRFLHAGDTLETPRTRITVLWPEAGKTLPGKDANVYPLVTLIDMENVKLLSMSDQEGLYERYVTVDADILKVAHHGSRGATGADFLHNVSPQYALITGSASGRGLPDKETLSRLAEAGVLGYNTGETGAMTLYIHNGHGQWSAFLK